MNKKNLARAAACQAAGDLDAAQAIYHEVLHAEPHHVGALSNLGLLYLQRGDQVEALKALRRVVAMNDAPAEAHAGYARALFASDGAGEEARRHFDIALDLRPDLRSAHLGRLVLAERLLADDAAALARSAESAFPRDGLVLLRAGQAVLAGGDAVSALVYLENAIADETLSLRALTELAAAFMTAGAGPESIAMWRRAVAEHPQSATAQFNLAVALRMTNQFEEAISVFDEAVAVGEDASSVAVERAVCLVRLGRSNEVQDFFNAIVEAGGTAGGTSTALMAALYDDRSGAQICDLHRRAVYKWPVTKDRPVSASYASQDVLPVAFLSGDFQGRHPVAQFMLPLLERLPAHGVAPKIWLTAPSQDQTENWLLRNMPTGDLTGLNDAEAATAIAADAPALLIDLAGHTHGNRLAILGQRPAPQTACFLGYPSTTGYTGVDLLIADEVLVPSGHEDRYTEEIARLPDSFLCFSMPPDLPKPRPTPPKGRPLRFGSLNAHAKINTTTLTLWAGVLDAVPGAELLVKCGEFAEIATRTAFARRAAESGIDPARLVLEGPAPFKQAMAAYRGIDIALDPLPYNGGTTTCHALFFGTPVVTLAGDRFSARMGASVLRAAGHPEWIAQDAQDYVAIASGLAADRDALHDTRCALADTVPASPLGDIDRYAAGFAALCRRLTGAPPFEAPAPAPFKTNPSHNQQPQKKARPMQDHPSESASASPGPQNTAPAFEITTSRLFEGFLADTGASLAITTYQAGMVLLIGTDPQTGKLWIFNRHLERPMGIACDRTRMVVAGLTQIVTFLDGHHGTPSDGSDPVYVPQVSHFTGDLDVHDLAFDSAGGIVFVNTLFSCLATVSPTHSFRPVWTPPFIDRLAAEDRCHLNGLAMRDGQPAFVTAVSTSNVADGWREHRRDGGIIMDVSSGETVASGLSMPHSPRWHDGKLWVLNAGTGELGTVDLANGAFTPVAFCPGFLRGLTFLGRYAIVGTSEPRENRTFGGLALQDRLAREGVAPRCGLHVIDTVSGDVVHWLRLHGVVTELFDIAVIPRARQPSLVGFRSDEIRRVVSIDDADGALMA